MTTGPSGSLPVKWSGFSFTGEMFDFECCSTSSKVKQEVGMKIARSNKIKLKLCCVSSVALLVCDVVLNHHLNVQLTSPDIY